MKKLYASLALVAAGAIAASAASFTELTPFNEGKVLRGSKIMDASKRLPVSAVADKAQKINERYTANRAPRAFEGSKLTTAINGFDDYEQNGTFTITANNTLSGFQGWAADLNFVEQIKYKAEIGFTLTEAGDVEIPLGQVLGTYSGADIIFFGVDKDDQMVTKGSVVYKAQADGSYVADLAGVGTGFINPATGKYAFFSLEYNSKILDPNASVTYHWIAGNGTDFGNFTVPVFIGFEDSEYEGQTYTSMYMSAIMYELSGDGFPASYEVEADGEGFQAIASSPICVYNEDNSLIEGGNIVYRSYSSTLGGGIEDVIWDVNSDKSDIALAVLELTKQSTGEKGLTDALNMHNSEYTFGQLYDLKVDMNAGVEEILENVVNENAPVEYYNLQGMKINNPAAGQIVIRRQGNKTSKMIVR